MSKPRRGIRWWKPAGLIATGALLFQLPGCFLPSPVSDLAAYLTTGLTTSILNQFISRAVSDTLGVPSFSFGT
jgi:hypothetical protein